MMDDVLTDRNERTKRESKGAVEVYLVRPATRRV